MASPETYHSRAETTGATELRTEAGEGSDRQRLTPRATHPEIVVRLKLALFEAISSGKAHKVQSLLESNDVDIDFHDSQLQTPLIRVCSTPQKSDLRTHLVRMLLNKGANVNVQDRSGKTALMYCCIEAEKQDALRILVRNRNLDPNKQDADGDTALLHCVKHSNLGGLRILLQSSQTRNRIHVDRRNHDGVTPLLLASKLANKECCQALIEAGASPAGLPSQLRNLLLSSPESPTEGSGAATAVVGYLARRKQLLSPLPGQRWPLQLAEEVVGVESAGGKKRGSRGKKKKTRGHKTREEVPSTTPREGYLQRPDPFSQESNRLPQITHQKNLTGHTSGIF